MSASHFCTLFLMNPCSQKSSLPYLPKLPLRMNKIESFKRYAHHVRIFQKSNTHKFMWFGNLPTPRSY